MKLRTIRESWNGLRGTLKERFWIRVHKTKVPSKRCKRLNIGPCWLWTGATQKGYGAIGEGGRGGKMLRAHRVCYEFKHGPIPRKLDLDHLCRIRLCVRPSHLEPVTRRVNLLRGDTIAARKAAQTECIRGHSFDKKNTYIATNGTRKCRECHRIRNRTGFSGWENEKS